MFGNLNLFGLVFIPIIGAFISYGLGRYNKRGRDYFANILMFVMFILVVKMALTADYKHPWTFSAPFFAGFGINFVFDGFRSIYAVITVLMWMMTTIFSREYFAHYHNRNRYYFFMLLTFGGTMGVFLSADLLTTFMFFEVMSFTSYVMVIHEENAKTQKAAQTYMAVAVIGGLMILMGIFLLYVNLGTVEIDKLYDAAKANHVSKGLLYTAASFLLFGFGGKAGMYLLHIWLPNAHPVAPAPASALLSGVLTKTGVYGILVLSVLMLHYDVNWGIVILILGVAGMFTGALLALFSIDLKRTLACSSMSQIGFILVGVGMQNILGHHNALAVRGTLLHMVNHSLIKLVLFMMAGVVYMNLHKLDLNLIRGFGRKKFVFTFSFLMGVLGIIGLPLWNGYISKTLLHESIVEQIWLYHDYSWGSTFYQIVESIFTLTGGLTTAYMIKIFVAVCIEKNPYATEHAHGDHGHEEHGHEEHGHEEHGHEEHVHENHGHEEHGHEEHIHENHGHEEHGHKEHIHENHGHEEHGHEDHGHEDHGHSNKYMTKTSSAVLFISALLLPILGFNGNKLMMNGIGKLGQTFMHGHEPDHAVHFYAWMNLRGAVASLTIGAIIYYFIVRKCLMAKDENGNMVYIDAWPPALNIEERIYYPLLNTILPTIGGTFAYVISVIPEKIGNSVRLFFVELKDYNIEQATAPKEESYKEKYIRVFLEKPESVQKKESLKEKYIRMFLEKPVTEEIIGEEGVEVSEILEEESSRFEEFRNAFESKNKNIKGNYERFKEGIVDSISKKMSDIKDNDKKYVSIEERIVLFFKKLKNLFCKYILAQDVDMQENQSKVETSDSVNVVIQSLTYSLMLFLLGFLVIMLIILFK